MAIRLQQKSDLYVFAGYVLLLIALAVNPLTIKWLQGMGIFPEIAGHFRHQTDDRILLPIYLDALLLVCGIIILRSPRSLKSYFNDSFAFNLFLFLILSGILLSTNVIIPGKFRVVRILFILLLMFLLTNTLYQAVGKKRENRPIHPFYRNLGLVLYGLVLVFLLLEIVFMFFLVSHRYNGTLASRAWFVQHWELNSEGYRDGPIRHSDTDGKKNLLVLGDSFVAGHGIDDPKDRFSDLLQELVSDKWKVYNLGLGGSDLANAFARLKEFPVQPDLLVLSYYPNDIEHDGELAGLNLQTARPYNDVGRLPLYFIRRSYMLNYLYWIYPHPDEMSDYLGYLRQCYEYKPALDLHLSRLDSMTAYADSLGIPMATVVFPILENVEGSGFATNPIVSHLRTRGYPTVDVRAWAGDYSIEELIVNRNDTHASEKLHALIADSLYDLLQRNGYLSAEWKLPPNP